MLLGGAPATDFEDLHRGLTFCESAAVPDAGKGRESFGLSFLASEAMPVNVLLVKTP